MPASHALDRTEITFDDEHAVANAGLVLTATLAARLGIEHTVDQTLDLGDRPGASRPGRKVMTLVESLVAGGDCIEDADVLRSGATEAVLPHKAMAPSTLGTFLRSFTFGHVRQLDKVFKMVLQRAWAAGAGPGAGPMTIDVDSTICEVQGYAKQGAAYGHTRVLGLHPLLATRAETGEVLHVRLRKGSANTARGGVRFIQELIAGVRRAGASGPLTLRADSGFWSGAIIATCKRSSVRFSITVRQIPQVKQTIAAIPEGDWIPIDYTDKGVAQIAETTYKGERLIVRRTRLLGPQAQLWPDWRYHGFITDREGEAVALDADHRRHAVVELAIRDLKQGAGMNHCPSGSFFANAAWLAIAAMAHNLIRWTANIGLGVDTAVVAKTIRRRFIAVGGRLTRSARRLRLHLPRRWPWAEAFSLAISRIRALPLLA